MSSDDDKIDLTLMFALSNIENIFFCLFQKTTRSWIETTFQKRECKYFVPSAKDEHVCGCAAMALCSLHNPQIATGWRNVAKRDRNAVEPQLAVRIVLRFLRLLEPSQDLL
ncbi:hypothetical protein ACJJTC_016298 [Scirpophaga incertulas]